MANEGNLKPFTTETGRAAGMKSKRRPLEVRIRDYVEARERKGDKKTREELMHEAQYKMALKGSTHAYNALLDRGYGKSKQAVEVSGTGRTLLDLALRDECEEELERIFKAGAKGDNDSERD